MAELIVTIRHEAGFAVVELAGKISADTASLLEGKMVPLLGETRRVVLDLSRISFIATVGLGLLSRWRAEGAEIVLCSLSSGTEKLIGMVGFDKIFRVFASQNEAKSHFTGR